MADQKDFREILTGMVFDLLKKVCPPLRISAIGDPLFRKLEKSRFMHILLLGWVIFSLL